jgi:hypothetical protein
MSEVIVIVMRIIVVGAGSAVGTSLTARGPAGVGSAIDHMEDHVRHDISSAYSDHTRDTYK